MGADLHRALAEFSLRHGISIRQRVLDECVTDLLNAARIVTECLRSGNKVLFFGNGGSAADAQHLSAELVGRYKANRAPLAAMSLNIDASALTAIGNDFGFEEVFSRQIEALARPGDVVVAITTSGSSRNITNAIASARKQKARVIGLTSTRAGADFSRSCDVVIRVPSSDTARIQEMHIALGHVLCELIDYCQSTPFSDVRQSPSNASKLIALDELVAIREYLRTDGKTVVWTNGCFDIVHAGHIDSLMSARMHGDVLVVGLNSDSSVRSLKGAERPFFSVAQRATMLSAFEMVDYVVIFDDLTPTSVLERLRPDVHCKGDDYKDKSLPESDVVEKYGGRVVFLPLVPGLSTTAVLQRTRAS